MSEQFPTHETRNGYAEQLAELEHQTAGEEVRELTEHASPERSSTEQLGEVRAEVAAVAETIPAPQVATEAQPVSAQTLPLSKDLRSLTAARALSSIRHNLSLPDKALSTVIHQPVVRVISNAGAKTVARPAALFTGGLLAFVGSSVYLYMASHIGLTYNYAVAGLLFAAGFILGIIVEGFLAVARRAKR